MKGIQITSAVLITLAALISYGLSSGCDRVYDLRWIPSMETLTKDDIIAACDKGIFHELLIDGLLNAPGVRYHVRIFEDGSGLFEETVMTYGEKESMAKYNGDPSVLSWQEELYKSLVDSLPDGDYQKWYEFSITKEDVAKILSEFADDNLFSDNLFTEGKFESSEQDMIFVFSIYLNGKAKEFGGFMFEPMLPETLQEHNAKLRSILEQTIIPMIRSVAVEIGDHDYAIRQRELFAQRAGKASYVTVSYR